MRAWRDGICASGEMVDARVVSKMANAHVARWLMRSWRDGQCASHRSVVGGQVLRGRCRHRRHPWFNGIGVNDDVKGGGAINFLVILV